MVVAVIAMADLSVPTTLAVAVIVGFVAWMFFVHNTNFTIHDGNRLEAGF